MSLSLWNLAVISLFLLLAGCTAPAVNPGLHALYPLQKADFFNPPGAFVLVDSLQPTLRWESFPRSRDLTGSNADRLRRVEDVTYELVIADAVRDWEYRRTGLKESHHKVETPLNPKTKYLWTVRACFQIDGEPRCTEWGAISDWESQAVWHPNSSSYRLMTP